MIKYHKGQQLLSPALFTTTGSDLRVPKGHSRQAKKI
jgi:hypothetical protein